jgi:hypothetical protein
MLRSASRLCARRQATAACAPLSVSALTTPAGSIAATLPHPLEKHGHRHAFPFRKLFLSVGAAGALLGAATLGAGSSGSSSSSRGSPQCAADDAGPPRDMSAPGLRPGMPVYSRADVAKHSTLGTGVWTTFANGQHAAVLYGIHVYALAPVDSSISIHTAVLYPRH